MSYTLRAQLDAILNVWETADETTSPASDEAGRTRQFTDYSTSLALHGGSTSFPEIGGPVADLSQTLAGASADIDLTAAPQANDIARTKDFTGKRLVALVYYFPRTNNAAGCTFGGHGANPYTLFGTTVKPAFYPGANGVLFYADRDQGAAFTSPLPAVAAGAKDLRLTGTAADVMKMLAIFSE